MPNLCELEIKRGKNKGQQCKNVNRTCRHQKNLCMNCGLEFSYKHTFMQHTCQIETRRETAPKVKIIVKDRKTTEMEILRQRLMLLEKQNKKLENRVSEAEQRPSINNIVVIGNDFYSELVDKVGKDNAVQYLTTSAVGRPIEVIDKLYLEGKDPMDYPIACRNADHFRYLNSESKIVDDFGGSYIGDIMTDRLQHAMLMAINEAIRTGEPEADDKELDSIVEAQRYVTSGLDKANLLHELSVKTSNAGHPFFRENM